MTQAEAAVRCEELNRERSERDPPWILREISPGDWRPVRPRIPDLPRADPFKATTEAKPKPSTADDPRDSVFRNIPPVGGAG